MCCLGLSSKYGKVFHVPSALQEIKSGDTAHVRSLLARATSLSLPPKKMKVLFKRWLEFEQTHGSAADVAQVKLKAIEYMEQQAT